MKPSLRASALAVALVFSAAAARASVPESIALVERPLEPESGRWSLVLQWEHSFAAGRSGSLELRAVLANPFETEAKIPELHDVSSGESDFTPGIPRSVYFTATYWF
jgi:hypothetical protein